MDQEPKKRKRQPRVVTQGLVDGSVEDAVASVGRPPKKSKTKGTSLQLDLDDLPEFTEEDCDRDLQRSLGVTGVPSGGEGSEASQDEEEQESHGELDWDSLLSKLCTDQPVPASDEEEITVVSKKKRSEAGPVATAVTAPPTPKFERKRDRVRGECILVAPASPSPDAEPVTASSSSSGLRYSCCKKLFDEVS